MKHGEVYAYSKGCRCEPCIAGWKEYQIAWRAARLAAPDCPHGNRVTYLAGCRCDKCRAANAAYNMNRKSVVRASSGPVRHGTEDGYGTFGCRCDACKSAKKAGTRKYYLEHQIEFFEKAARRGVMKKRDERLITAKDIVRMIGRLDGRCFYCGSLPEHLEIDHVVPLSRGGRHAIGNLVPACRPCNRAKHARFVVEFRYGRREPRAVA